MLTYARSRLEASGPVTNSAKRHARRALKKQFRTAPGEKLIMEIEMYIPHNVTDIKGNEQRVAEVVAKLANKLKEGPLKHSKTDQEWLDGAIRFLVTDEGKSWIRWWFQPQMIVVGTASIPTTITSGKAPTVAVGKAKMMPNVHLHGNTQLEHQGGPSHSTGVQLHETQTGITPLLSSPIMDSFAIGPAVTTPRSMVSRGTALGIGSSHLPVSAPSSSLIEMASAAATKPASLAREVAGASSHLLPRTSQHQRSHSDPGQVSLCLQCYTVHGMSYGGPFPTVPSSSEAMPTTRGMQVQRNARNDRWAVYIMRRVPFGMMAWALFIVFMVQLSRGYPKN